MHIYIYLYMNTHKYTVRYCMIICSWYPGESVKWSDPDLSEIQMMELVMFRW